MPEAVEVDVAALVAEVRRIDLQSRRLVTDAMTGGYTSVFRGAGIEFDRVREYVEGDDRRSVDGAVTARMGRPFVRTYVAERERTVVFLVDLSASMRGGFGAWSARETAARVVACLALSAVRSRDRVGLVGYGDGVRAFVPPAKGAGHALRVVRDCLALAPHGRATDPGPALDLVARGLRRHAVVLWISDFLSGPIPPALRLCARRHDLVAVRIVPPEAATPPRGLLRVVDPESGRAALVDFGSRRVREAYVDRVAARSAEVDEALRRAGVDRVDVAVPRAPSREAISRPLLAFFRMRERRGAKR
jgi:uncharacterized protein (DUF58 family)